MVAGLDPPTSGTVEIFGDSLRGINARAGYMFQHDALLPWKTVLDNVLLGPTFRNCASRERAREWLKRVGLEGFETYFSYQLSGGMRKRVAMAQNSIVKSRHSADGRVPAYTRSIDSSACEGSPRYRGR
jgi:NitT/TauT family transport system ATP-binding protein